MSLKCPSLIPAHVPAFPPPPPRGALLGQSGPRCCVMSAHFSRANLVYNCISVLPSSLVILTQMGETVKFPTSLYDLVSRNLGHFFFTDNHLIHFLPGNMSLPPLPLLATVC